jgi:hypothetical protein
MRTARRLVRDESGMTMGLAIIMIVLIGVMGAGLLTFVSRDLNTVVEENRGQRAFGMSDAGVQAAQRQLLSDCGSATDCEKYYNDTSSTVFVGAEDKRWSKAKGGLTLNDLDGDGDPSDNVKVEIETIASTANPYDFTVTSTGNYGDNKRKIEAKLGGTGGTTGGGTNVINPAFYTPSDILIKGTFTLTGISLFSDRDIIIKNLSPKTRQGFQTDASTNSGGTLLGASTGDPLSDWYSPSLTPSGNWNMNRRKQKQPSTQNYDRPGFAALGKICSPVIATQNTCLATDPSVADGVEGYDSTTGSLIDPTLTASTLGSNLKRFYAKDAPCTSAGVCPTPLATQPSDTITYPFPRVRPNASSLKNRPGTKYWACPSAAPSTCTPPWSTTLFPSSAPDDQVVFIDAKNNNLTLDIGNQSTGILLVWCGNLTLASPYKGIIINLYGNGSSFGATDCATDPSKGVFTLATAANENVQAWVYSNGGTGTALTAGIPGITFNSGAEVKAVPGGGDLASNLAAIAFGAGATPPTAFSIEGWRELYQ